MLETIEIERAQASLAHAGWTNLAAILKLLADPSRLAIFQLLGEYRELCPTDIARTLGVSISAASYQCRLLAVAGLVTKRRMGRMMCFSLNDRHPLVPVLAQFLTDAKGRIKVRLM